MKIIRKGHLPDLKLHGTCFRCGCQVECEKSEANESSEPHEGQRAMSMFSVKCPTDGCGRNITLKP